MTRMASFPIVSTRHPDEAESAMSRELADLRLERVQSPKDFRLEMNGVHLGDALLTYTQFDTDVIVNPGEMHDALAILVGVGERSVIYVDGSPVPSDTRVPIVAPPRNVVHHYAARGGFFVLRLEYGVLMESLQKTLDRTLREPLRFDKSVVLDTSFGRYVQDLVEFLASAAERDPTVLAHSALRAGFNDLAISALLSAPSNYSAELNDDRAARAGPAVVRRAEGFLAAYATEPITIDRLLEECGCSRRALFKAFRESRGYTPMQFLMDRRLDLARESLRTAPSGETVSSIAYTCGFSHPGRFATAYRTRFGERPSETLRRGRRAR